MDDQQREQLREAIKEACYDFGRWSRRRTVSLEEIGAYADHLAQRVLTDVFPPSS